MTKQVLNRGTIANDGTGDTLRTAGLKINANFDELYQFLGGKTDGTLSNEISLENDAIVFEGSSTDQHEVRLKAANATADRILTLPNADGEFVLTVATQTLTNKTITNPTVSDLVITDGGSNHEYSLIASDIAADRNINLPALLDSDELTFNEHTQTLTNKTLTSPTISSPRVKEAIRDSSSNELIDFAPTTSAVNHIQVVNNVDGLNPRISAVGDNTNINLELYGKGTGSVAVESKLTLKTEGITTNGVTVSLNAPISYFNKASGTNTATLPNGVEDGEVKYLININQTGSYTITITGNPSGVQTVVLPPNKSVQLIWASVGGTQNWYVISNNGATIS